MKEQTLPLFLLSHHRMLGLFHEHTHDTLSAQTSTWWKWV